MIRTARVLCERCNLLGLVVPGRDVHHKIDPRDDIDKAFDPSNVELLCKSCHSKETASKHK
ncbi:HNH endonuclease [Singulisphaera sp. PoT]|uniref:HNH endonuclease n=1 Tax=Singulisphaera sp. PoT TaxID=3411797 RepID=UPI003BF549F4